jgi:ankyrin repeat protein
MKSARRFMPYIDPSLDIWSAAKKGLLDKVQELVAAGQNINAPTRGRVTPLHEAADAGQLAIVQWLLANGADPNAKTIANPGDAGSYTPLHLAVRTGHIDVVKLLLDHSGINAKMSDGTTALMIAAENGRLDIATQLLKFELYTPTKARVVPRK